MAVAFIAPEQPRSLKLDCTLVKNALLGRVISGYILNRRKLRQEDYQLTQIPMLIPFRELGTHNALFIPWPLGWIHGHLMGTCGALRAHGSWLLNISIICLSQCLEFPSLVCEQIIISLPHPILKNLLITIMLWVSINTMWGLSTLYTTFLILKIALPG